MVSLLSDYVVTLSIKYLPLCPKQVQERKEGERKGRKGEEEKKEREGGVRSVRRSKTKKRVTLTIPTFTR